MMTYPRLSAKDARQVRDRLRAALEDGESPATVEERGFAGLEERFVAVADCTHGIQRDELYKRALANKRELLDDGGVDAYKANGTDKRDFYLEELMAPRLHEVLDALDPVALHDAGFWRYLALFPYRWFLMEREESMMSHDYGGAEGQREKWLLIRAYQWGRKCNASDGSQPYERALAVRQAKRRLGVTEGYTIDFYHSHIVRPRWADTSQVSGAFIDSATTAPEALDTGIEAANRPVAQLAKLVARLANNISLVSLSPEEVRGLIDREKMRVLKIQNG